MKLTVEHVSKRYGKLTAVKDMNVVFTPGIIGLLGANGSGKTTLLRMLVDVLPNDEGRILFNDVDINQQRGKYLAEVGYMPQHLGMYPTFKVTEFLQYMGAVKGLTKDYTTKRIQELLPLVHLENEQKKKIKALSGGMRQRLGIAQALLNDPAILVLDEPTAGLDPKERNQFSRMLSELSRDKIILLSTHIVSDVESIANRIMIMKKGNMIAYDTSQKLLQVLKGKVRRTTLAHEELHAFQSKYVICSQKEAIDHVEVRYIDEQQTSNGEIVDAVLNDLYLYYFEEEAR